MIGLGGIRGQDRAIGLLRRALASGKLPHALLFAGPPGVGKGATARALAMALNCERGAEDDGGGCGACGPCERIAVGIHPDFLEIGPGDTGQIPIATIRELIARLGLSPHEARARVVVIDEADRLNPQAANAFLKTLEEPPARTHLVLVTTAPDRLLVTIRSRCQRVRFVPLGADAIAAILVDQGVPAERARTAAGIAAGSARRALELADGEALERRWTRARTVLEAARAPGLKPAVDAALALAEEKEDLGPTLEMLAYFYRDAAALAAGVDLDKLVHRDRADDLRTVAQQAPGPAALARRAAAILDAQTAIMGFANPQLTLEQMILGLREG